ncbi:MAG: hypothetical protein MJ120_02755 [Clostridia bacterium]|nr:hypothetical protein [Clostridia bacterium]
MDEKYNGARRRRAFADFKENQYDDTISLSPAEKNKKAFKKGLQIALMVLLTIFFIILGFSITDSLMSISQEPYNDKNTYTAAFINTTTTTTTTAESSEDASAQSGASQPNSVQNTSAGNY